jgi:hypothetical protein
VDRGVVRGVAIHSLGPISLAASAALRHVALQRTTTGDAIHLTVKTRVAMLNAPSGLSKAASANNGADRQGSKTQSPSASGYNNPAHVASEEELNRRERDQVRDQATEVVRDRDGGAALRKELEDSRPGDRNGREQGMSIFRRKDGTLFEVRWSDEHADRISIPVQVTAEDGQRLIRVPDSTGGEKSVKTDDVLVASSHSHGSVAKDRFAAVDKGPSEEHDLYLYRTEYNAASRSLGSFHLIVTPQDIWVLHPGRHPDRNPEAFRLGDTDELLPLRKK